MSNRDLLETAEDYLDTAFEYYRLGELDKAIEVLLKVPEEVPEAYANAQLNLGVVYQKQGELEKAIKAYLNVPKEVQELYAKAQLNLGVVYEKQGKLEEAIKAWRNVPEEVPEAYAQAQLNLGVVYEQQGKLEEAIEAWQKVPEEIPEEYARAQFNLGVAYQKQGELEKAIEAFSNSSKYYYYKSECIIKILKCQQENDVRDNLYELANRITEILNHLCLIPEFERKVAHYTRCQIAFQLLESDKKKASVFRLSTMGGVNDPMEGKVLNQYLGQRNMSNNLHPDAEIATFVSCFTFNHDSLNQFRLYGKENNQEASGVSLVLNVQGFFDDDPDKRCMFISAGKTADLNQIVQSSLLENQTSFTLKIDQPQVQEEEFKKIDKLPLYRCIYLDPENDFFALAARDELTFYRQYDNAKHLGHASTEWKKYQEKILEKTNNIRGLLYLDTNSVLALLKKFFWDNNNNQNETILDAVRFILLPLQYLVKHAAFQEEQECRMLYITQWDNDKIHNNYKHRQMYIEYKESMRSHIQNIYLSPGAAEHQDAFKVLLKGKGVVSKIRISKNPFRHKR